MKLKENKGMSLIVFTITLAVLLVVAGGVIVYLLNSPEKENIDVQNSVILEGNVDNNNNFIENDTDISKKEIIESEYKSLKELALLKISSDKLNQKEEIYEYDFNKDEIKEKITLKETEDEYTYSIYYENQQLFDYLYNFNIYVVDLDKDDQYLDLIISSISDGGESTWYYIYKNNGMKLDELKYTREKAITGDYKGDNLYLNGKNNFLLISDVESYLDKFTINTYYTIENNVVYNTKIESPNIAEEYTVEKEYLDFSKEYMDTYFRRRRREVRSRNKITNNRMG